MFGFPYTDIYQFIQIWNYCLIYKESHCLMIFKCFFFGLNCVISLSCVSLLSFSFQLESYHSGTSKFFARRFTFNTIATLDIFYFLVHGILQCNVHNFKCWNSTKGKLMNQVEHRMFTRRSKCFRKMVNSSQVLTLW